MNIAENIVKRFREMTTSSDASASSEAPPTPAECTAAAVNEHGAQRFAAALDQIVREYHPSHCLVLRDRQGARGQDIGSMRVDNRDDATMATWSVIVEALGDLRTPKGEALARGFRENRAERRLITIEGSIAEDRWRFWYRRDGVWTEWSEPRPVERTAGEIEALRAEAAREAAEREQAQLEAIAKVRVRNRASIANVAEERDLVLLLVARKLGIVDESGDVIVEAP